MEKFFVEHTGAITIISMLLTILALILAALHAISLKKTTASALTLEEKGRHLIETIDKIEQREQQLVSRIENVDSQSERLLRQISKIEEGLSTKYLDEFPKFIPEITRIISDAKEKVYILCDYPAYGCFTDSKEWQAYDNKLLEKKINKVPISVITNTAKKRKEMIKQQFDPIEWKKWLEDEGNIIKMKNYFLTQGKDPNDVSKIQNFDEFLLTLDESDESVLRKTFTDNVVEKFLTDELIPINLWIVDEKLAVFTLPSYSTSGKRTEFGFRTSDKKLLSSLTELFKTYRQQFKNNFKKITP